MQQRLSEALPQNLRLLAPVLTRTARDLAYDIILRIIQNERFQAVFDRALTVVHQQVLRIIEGDSAIVFEDDKVIIDLREVLPESHMGDVSRVNLFQKVVRLRNGVSHKL